MAIRGLLCTRIGIGVEAPSSTKENFCYTVRLATRSCTTKLGNTWTLVRPPLPHGFGYAYGNCVHNAISAVVGRIGKTVPKFNQSHVTCLKKYFRRISNRIGPLSPLTPEEFVKNYKGAKRRRYEKAKENLASGFKQPVGKVKMFVKTEVAPYKIDKAFPACRPIQFRDYEYALELGRFIKPVEKGLYNLAGGFGCDRHPIIAKSHNPRKRAEVLRAKWLEFRDPVAYMWDASRFDAHVSSDILSLEHLVYKRCHNSAHLNRLLRAQIENRGSFRDKDGSTIRYKVRGTRMSGDMNTASGNCIIMVSILCYVYDLTGARYSIYDDGDDSVVITEGEVDPAPLVEIFRELGFVMELEGKTRIFEEIRFCQSSPVQVRGQWTMVREPYRLLTKLLTNTSIYNERHLLRKYYTIAQCELACSVGVPIIQELCCALMLKARSKMSRAQIVKGYDRTIVADYRYARDLPEGWSRARPASVHPQTRVSYAKAFGIWPSEQRSMESSLKSWDPFAAAVTCESLSDRWEVPVYQPDSNGSKLY